MYLLCEDDAMPLSGKRDKSLCAARNSRDDSMVTPVRPRFAPSFAEEWTRLLHATKLHDPRWEAPSCYE